MSSAPRYNNAIRLADCLLTEHQFVHEKEIFGTAPPVVNYRRICKHCGCYRVVTNEWESGTDMWDPEAGPYIKDPIFRGPDGRMPAYWENIEKVRLTEEA
jgi:hypothetical protein